MFNRVCTKKIVIAYVLIPTLMKKLSKKDIRDGGGGRERERENNIANTCSESESIPFVGKILVEKLAERKRYQRSQYS